jgi:hypothetical protein
LTAETQTPLAGGAGRNDRNTHSFIKHVEKCLCVRIQTHASVRDLTLKEAADRATFNIHNGFCIIVVRVTFCGKSTKEVSVAFFLYYVDKFVLLDSFNRQNTSRIIRVMVTLSHILQKILFDFKLFNTF